MSINKYQEKIISVTYSPKEHQRTFSVAEISLCFVQVLSPLTLPRALKNFSCSAKILGMFFSLLSSQANYQEIYRLTSVPYMASCMIGRSVQNLNKIIIILWFLFLLMDSAKNVN